MKSKEYRYYKSPMGIPSVLIICGWLALWVLWPRDGEERWDVRRRAGTRVFYSGVAGPDARAGTDELVFLRRARGLPKMERSDGPADHWEKKLGTPRILERRMVGEVPDAPDGASSIERSAARELSGYDPVWPREEFFRTEGEPAQGIMVDLSPGLLGLQMPETPWLAVPAADRPWQATLQVACGDDGRALHVFLERGSDDPEIDRRIVRALYRAVISAPKGPVEGRVTISGGRRRPGRKE